MSNDGRIRILVVDDHTLVRSGIVSLLSKLPRMDIVGEASDGQAALSSFAALKPDVTLIDLRMPGMDGTDVISLLHRQFPESKFIALTTYDGEDDVYRAFKAGASAYLLKGARTEELVEAIEAVHAGRKLIPPRIAERLLDRALEEPLDAREREILELVARGRPNQEIAAELGLAERTVKNRLTRIFGKLHVTSRTQAVIVALERGIVRSR